MKKFYVGIGAIIEKNNKYLTLKRSSEKDFGAGQWEVVTGRLEEEEAPSLGVKREIREETNIDVDIIMPVATGFFYRGGKEFPMIFIIFYCKYLKGEIKLSWEHAEYKWITLEEGLNSKDLQPFHYAFKNVQKLKKYIPEKKLFDLN